MVHRGVLRAGGKCAEGKGQYAGNKQKNRGRTHNKVSEKNIKSPADRADLMDVFNGALFPETAEAYLNRRTGDRRRAPVHTFSAGLLLRGNHE